MSRLMSPLTPEAFAQELNVSRETLGRLVTYEKLLRKWQPRINLIGSATLPDVWQRHFLDSAQLLPLLPKGATRLLDLGSGAGFPGLVLAIMGVPDVHLVESDARKCAFLAEAARVTGTTVQIHNRRIEDLEPFSVDVITARALAPVDRLLEWSLPFFGERTVALYLKGRSVDEELTRLEGRWKMSTEKRPSRSSPDGVILRLGDVSRV